MNERIKFVLIIAGLFWAIVSADAQESRRDRMDPLSRMFLLPSTEEFITPAELDLNAEPIALRNDAGHRLRGWYISTDDARQTIMVCPGNAGNVTAALPYAAIFADGGFNVLLFEYQGYGKSEGIPSLLSLTGDVTAAYDYLTGEKNVEPENIGVFGVSLGSIFSIYLAARNPVGALAVEDTFVPDERLESFMSRHNPGTALKTMLNILRNGPLKEVDPLKNVEQIACPMFFLHGQLDTFLPPAASCRVCDAAGGPKRIWIMQDVGHAPESLEVNDREYAHQLKTFFADAFADKVEDNQPTVSWQVKPESETTTNEPHQFETTINVCLDPRAAIEIALMDNDSQSVVLRRVCEGETVITVSTRFEPTFVNAVKCRYVLEVTPSTWQPDLSKLSKDRETLVRAETAFWQQILKYRQERIGDEDKRKSLELWDRIKPLFPEPGSVHPHIRPRYAELACYAFKYLAEADVDQLIPIWQRVLEYLPDQPARHYRLRHAGFDLGFENNDVSAVLRRWARIELQRGNINKSHELLRRYVQVRESRSSAVTNAMIANIETVEQFDALFGVSER